MKKYKLVSKLNTGDVIVQTIVWLLLTIITFGILAPFFAYYFFKLIINTTEIHEVA